MVFSWSIFLSWWPIIIEGFIVTLKAFILSAIFSLLVAIFASLMISSNINIIRQIFKIYVSIFRNSPLLVQLYFIFYGLPSVGIKISPFICGVIGITLNEGAFMTEIIRGSIRGISKGDWEAAESIGLTWFQTMRYVIFPQALRNAIPALTGQTSIILKDTSIFVLIMIPELTAAAGIIYSKTFNSMSYIIVAAIYILSYWVLNIGSSQVEKSRRGRV